MKSPLFKILIIQTFIILEVLLVNNAFSTAKWILGILLLILIIKISNLISPIIWLLVIWNLIFINAFGGIIVYHTPINYAALFYVALTLFFFGLGYFMPSSIKIVDLPNSFERSLKKNENIITTILSYTSIIGGIFIIIDMVFISGGSLSSFSTLRILYSKREVSIFGQLAAIFLSGGFLSLIVLSIFEFTKQRILILAIISLVLSSLFSAGRQNIFQMFIILIMTSIIRYRYNFKINFTRKIKIVLFFIIGITAIYLILLSASRDILSMDKNKLIGYSKTNNLNYNADFIFIMDKLPIEATNFVADFTFYFSEEIILYSDVFRQKEFPIINIDFLQFFPFFERQLSKFGLRENTLELRLKQSMSSTQKSAVFNSGWGTSTLVLLSAFGYIGGIIVVFFHGIFSKYIYRRFIKNPSFNTIFFLISNNLILFYTAITPITQETSFMFFMFISFIFLFFKEKKYNSLYNNNNNNKDL